MAARMRVSSSTSLSLMGTLKSTRIKTRWPLRSRSRMESLVIADFRLPIENYSNNYIFRETKKPLGTSLDQMQLQRSEFGNRNRQLAIGNRQCLRVLCRQCT